MTSINFSKRSVGSVAVATLLLMGAIAVLPLAPSAFAQTGTTITTSADANGSRFFGPALLEVLISVSSHASDTGTGNLPVTVTAFGASQTYQLTETGTTSGLFLMYVKVDPDVTTVEQPAAPITPFSATSTKLLIGTGAPAGGYGTVSQLAPSSITEGGSVQIAANGVTKTITWDDSAATLTLDRTGYGPGSTIIAQIKDQDSNLDPTRAETITDAGNLMLAAGGDAPGGAVTFTETGPNTATFELAAITAGGLGQGVDSIARSLTGNDYKAFSQAIASGPITPASSAGTFGFATTVQGTSTGSYTVQTIRGAFQPVNATTYATELPLRIDDLDRNTSTRSEQTVNGAIRVTIANAAAGAPGSVTNPMLFNMKELSLNSNTFKPNHSGDDIDVTPGVPLLNTVSGLTQQTADQNAGVLRAQPGNDIVIEYLDAYYVTAGATVDENPATGIKIDLNGNGVTTDAAVSGTVNEANIRLDLDGNGVTTNTVMGIVEANTRVDLNGDGDFNGSFALTGTFNENTPIRVDFNGSGTTGATGTQTIASPNPILEANIRLDLTTLGTIETTANANGITESLTRVDLNGIDLGGVSSRLTFQLGNTAPTLTADKTTASKGSTIKYTLTDPDLNDDTSVIESYTFNFNSGITGLDTDFQATTTPRVSAAAAHTGGAITPIYDARLRVSGAAREVASTFALTFTETGVNTGIFNSTLNLQTFTNAVGGSFQFVDGDNIELTLKDVEDQTQSVFTEVGKTVQIGLTKPTVTLDRTTMGVPRVDTGTDANDGALAIPKSAANLGNAVIGITIIDPSQNTNSQTEETLISSQAAVATDANGVLTLGNRLKLSLQTSSGGTFGGAGSIQVSESIRETGFDTGVFTGEIQVLSNPAETPAQWIGSKMKVEYAGQDGTFGNTDDADTTSVGFTARNAILSTDVTTITNGGKMLITVRDDDANRDVTTAEKVRVSIRWVDDTGATQFQTSTMGETGANTGIFTKTLTAGTSVIGGVTFRLQPDQDLRVRYYDLTPSVIGSNSWPLASSTQTQIDITLRTGAATGGLTVTPEQVGPATQVKVSVADGDLNTNPSSKQAVTGRVTVVSDRGAGSRADLNIDETGPSTAVFEGKVRLNPAQAAGAANSPGNDVTINALPGDIVSIRYEDEKGVNGQRTTVTKTVQVVSQDPKMNFSKASYSVGEIAELTINDLDANRDPDTADILTIRATSTTDAVGLTNVQAIETGANTGAFKAVIQTSRTFSTGVLQVSNGDSVTIEYEDSFPAAFRQKFDNNGTLAGSTQKFRINTVVGISATTSSTTAGAPALANVDGSAVAEVTSGQQVVITSNVKNSDDQARPATVIVEVRNADDITVYLQWQTATIAANGEIQVGLSWIPEEAGDYTIRTFVISGLVNPMVLSIVAASEVTVS